MLKGREGQIREGGGKKGEIRQDCGFNMFVAQDVSV